MQGMCIITLRIEHLGSGSRIRGQLTSIRFSSYRLTERKQLPGGWTTPWIFQLAKYGFYVYVEYATQSQRIIEVKYESVGTHDEWCQS
jgi:hypothetical protein